MWQSCLDRRAASAAPLMHGSSVSPGSSCLLLVCLLQRLAAHGWLPYMWLQQLMAESCLCSHACAVLCSVLQACALLSLGCW